MPRSQDAPGDLGKVAAALIGAMTLPLQSHVKGRIVATFVGFLGGGITFAMVGEQLQAGPLTSLLMPVFVFGLAYAAQAAFSQFVTAECPRCGGESVPLPGRNLLLYVCRACGAETNAVRAMVGAVGEMAGVRERRHSDPQEIG